MEARASGVRLPRHIANQLMVMGRLLEWTPLTGDQARMSRSLWWIQLSEQPTWLVLVVDETGEPIGGGIELENDQIDALAGVAEYLLPSGAGPTLLTIRDQAGEKIAGGLGYDSINGLAAVAESLLPRHPGGRRLLQLPGFGPSSCHQVLDLMALTWPVGAGSGAIPAGSRTAAATTPAASC